MIELVGLTKRFGNFNAVEDLTLLVPAGQIFGLLGPNGAGKTTTLRIMAGLLAPTRGKVFIDGISLEKEPEKAKRIIGFIPDRPYLYEKLTGLEFMKLTADLYQVEDKIFEEKAPSLLKLFSLTPWADELIESYSHGMKQRLIFCCALLHDPKVIIVDEPTVGLDPAGIRLLKEILKEKARKGTTVFISTHSLPFAEATCDLIGILNRGHLIAKGTLPEIKERTGLEGGALEEVFLKLTAGEMEP